MGWKCYRYGNQKWEYNKFRLQDGEDVMNFRNERYCSSIYTREYIVVDIDYNTDNGLQFNEDLKFSIEDVPLPTFIVKNPINKHAHLLWKLTNPVYIGANANQNAVEWLKNIQKSLTLIFKGDVSYTNGHKNPYSPDWEVENTGLSYQLSDFESVTLVNCNELIKIQKSVNNGYGRNCEIFDRTRMWCYQNKEKDYHKILKTARDFNEYYDPKLPDKEVQNIAKSITKFMRLKYGNGKGKSKYNNQSRAIALKVRQNNRDAKLNRAILLKMTSRTDLKRLYSNKSNMTIIRWAKRIKELKANQDNKINQMLAAYSYNTISIDRNVMNIEQKARNLAQDALNNPNLEEIPKIRTFSS